ncbi:MAG: hypothetical protein WDW38_000886 [Sanguina aurantia]
MGLKNIQEKSSRLDELQVNSDKVQGKFKHKLAEIRKMEAEVSRVEQNLHQFSLNMARGETNGGNFSGGISSGSAAKAIATASAADSDPADDPATTATTDFIPLQPTPSSSSQAGSNTRSRRRRRGGNFLRGGSGKPQSIQQGGAGGEKGGGVTEGEAAVQYSLYRAGARGSGAGKGVEKVRRRRRGGTAGAETEQEEVLEGGGS